MVTDRLDVDNAMALCIHHLRQQLLQPLQLDAITNGNTLVSHTQHKGDPFFECPNLHEQQHSYGMHASRAMIYSSAEYGLRSIAFRRNVAADMIQILAQCSAARYKLSDKGL